MKYRIDSFYNFEENSVDDKAYAHYYLALISTILPYFENDNIVENYKELVTKLEEDFDLTDKTNYKALVSRTRVVLEFSSYLFSLDIRKDFRHSFIDLHRTEKLNIYCTLVRTEEGYTPGDTQDIINNRFLHYNKLLSNPEGYVDMVFEHLVDD